jgi:hypothetical protein
MNDNDLEDLSRLLDGELSSEGEAALRARMETDEELRASWESMKALPLDLASLPEVAPSIRFKRRVSWGPWLLAAALALFALWPSSPSQLVVGPGSQLVDGHVLVQAGDRLIEVDGSALISVEPGEGVVREPAQENPMNRTALVGAAAGAVLTIAVYEGRATLTDPSGPQTIDAGQTLTVGEPIHAPLTEGPLSDEGEVAALRARVAELEQALNEVGPLTVITDGHSAKPLPWPSQHHAEFEPEAFAETLRVALDGREDLELVEVDCEEYPCLAVVESFAPSDGWEDEIEDVTGELEDLYADRGQEVGLGVWNHASRRDDEEEPMQLSGLLVAPADMTPEQQERVHLRMDSLLKELSD